MINSSSLTNNTATAEDGGAIFINNSVMTVNSSTFTGNRSGDDGGAINSKSSTLTINGSTLSNNFAADDGGAIDSDGGVFILSNSTISDNTASDEGGGIDADLGTVSIENSTLSGNVSGSNGGGIRGEGTIQQNATFTIRNSTLSHNSAAQGGGLHLSGTSTLNLSNSIIANSIGGDLFNTGIINPAGTNLVEDGSLTGNGILNLEPLLAPLGDYGGNTQTHALLPNSPALNAGDNALVNPATDQRGATRIADGTVDLGAFESQGFNLTLVSGDNQTTTVNTNFASPLVVQLTENFANAGVANAGITFTPTGTNASGNFNGAMTETVLTNSSGIATSSTLTANTVAGNHTLTSTITNTPGVSLNLTNAPDAPATVTLVQGDNQAAPIGTLFTETLTVTVTDQFGNPVPNVVVDFMAPATGASVNFVSGNSLATDANGMVSLNVEANQFDGNFSLAVRVTDLEPVSFNLTNSVPLELETRQLETTTGVTTETTTETQTTRNEEEEEGEKIDNPVVIASTVAEQVSQALEETESAKTQTYTDYLGLDPVNSKTAAEMQADLSQNDAVTGTTTAYITLNFTLNSSSPLSSEPAPTSPVGHHPKLATQLGTIPELDLDKASGLDGDKPNPSQPFLSPNDPEYWFQAQGANDEFEVMIVTADRAPILKRWPVNRNQLLTIARILRQEISDPNNTNNNRYQRAAQLLYDQMIGPITEDLQERDIDTLLISLDQGLRSLPIGALYDGEQFLIENYKVGLAPTMSLTDTSYVNLRERSALIMGASEFVSQSPLPAVEQELQVVAKQWNTTTHQAQNFFLNDSFSMDTLQAQRQESSPGIIHLTTHADFLPGNVSNSYIQLWGDNRLTIKQMPTLGWFTSPAVELLVLSACRTAVGSPEAELGFGGLAVQAGVRSALASLWFVSDQGTLALMSEFYNQLSQQETTVKAAALQQAQLALLRGEVSLAGGQLRFGGNSQSRGIDLPPELANSNLDLSHPYYWAAFTMIGSPW
jgi:predicted outer membrane repeat protein